MFQVKHNKPFERTRCDSGVFSAVSVPRAAQGQTPSRAERCPGGRFCSLEQVERENRILKWALAGVLTLGMATSAASQEQGWILMLPPLGAVLEDGTHLILRDAPISQWRQFRAFDTARHCEEWVDIGYEQIKKAKAKWEKLAPFDKDAYNQHHYARCVPAAAVYPPVKEK